MIRGGPDCNQGITLPVEQFGKLASLLPRISAVLQEKGDELPQPLYDEAAAADPSAGLEASPSKTKATKQNFEETTSEDE